jgi:hypothetical protein
MTRAKGCRHVVPVDLNSLVTVVSSFITIDDDEVYQNAQVGAAAVTPYFHNIETAEIAVIASKPAEHKLDFIHLRWRESTTIAAI